MTDVDATPRDDAGQETLDNEPMECETCGHVGYDVECVQDGSTYNHLCGECDPRRTPATDGGTDRLGDEIGYLCDGCNDDRYPAEECWPCATEDGRLVLCPDCRDERGVEPIKLTDGGEQPRDETEGISVWERAILALPDPPSISNNAGFWAVLGTAHGAWLIEYDVLPGQYVIWGAIVIAVLAQVMR